MSFNRDDFDKLTFDTDNARVNSHPTAVVTSAGQVILFYSKVLVSGRTSDTRVTFTGGTFNISVEGGSGELNGSSISWGLTSITASASSYELVYVTSAGAVLITDTWDMTLVQNSILLAFVSSGYSEIVSVEEIEKTGNYIYYRKQVNSGGTWIWDNTEGVLNTGKEPKVIYDIDNDKIYLSYRKDSISYTRVLDLNQPLTFEYIPNTFKTTIGSDAFVYLNRNPENSINFQSGSGYRAQCDVENVTLFTINNPYLNYQWNGSSWDKYVWMPTIGGDYTSYIIYPFYIDFYVWTGSSWELEVTYDMYNNVSLDRYRLWTGSNSEKRVGARVRSTLTSHIYEIDEEDRKIFHVFDPFDKTIIVDSENIESNCLEGTFYSICSSGYRSKYDTVFTYEETKNFKVDTLTFQSGAGYRSKYDTIFTYEETKNFQVDTLTFQSGAGYRSKVEIT